MDELEIAEAGDLSEAVGPEGGAAGIAVVGMAGRFPGAADLDRFWANLLAGVESVTFFRREELEAAGVDPAELGDPSYVPARAVIEGADRFDAELFGYSPREAEVMDPQHRLLLECAWEALEHAGYDPRRYAADAANAAGGGLIGVYAGASPSTYLLFHLLNNREALSKVGALQTMLANGGDFLATRLSYKLGLRGPSLTVQTACSTSLVAVHLAVQSLLNGECDMALAGGVRVSVPRAAGYLYQTDGILSPDGHCRPFDADARGSVDGEGAGLVVLKRLADALADGDSIHAVILGTATNNDGDGRVGFTAPGVEGQAGVLAMAQAVSGIDPETVGLVECHGTATPLGDPVEVAALRQVFDTPAVTASGGRSCALGSVKGNIGHLDAAAGVASLIKAVLAVESGRIPPTAHFRHPNPQLGLEDSPFFVNAEPVAWPAGHEVRRAGVSSFGMGGTNAHVVLEEAPPLPAGDPAPPHQLLVLSAAHPDALEAMTDRLADHLARQARLDGAGLADVAFTLQMGRQVLPYRRMLVCGGAVDAAEALATRDPRRVLSRVQEPGTRPIAFLFPGVDLEREAALARRWMEWGIVPSLVYDETGFGLQELPDVPVVQGLETVLARPGAILLEMGEGGLVERARRHPAFGSEHDAFAAGDTAQLAVLGQLWLAGAEPDWRAVHGHRRRLRVPLPTYPFQRQAYWIGGEAVRAAEKPAPGQEEAKPAAPSAPRRPRPRLSGPYVPPRDEPEQRLAGLFEEILGIEPVGVYDRFFEIGGHSLLGLQLLSRIKSELATEVRLEALFQAPSVAELAELIQGAGQERFSIPRMPRGGDLPLSFAQERLWFLDRLDPGTPTFNLDQAVRLSGALDVAALARSLNEVVRRHESLRTAFLDVRGTPAQRILPALEVPLPLVDLSALPAPRCEPEAERLATRAGDRRFDLARPPLLDAQLYRLAPDHHVAALVLHHIVGDGWSISVLLAELAEIYGAFAAGAPSPLPELPVQYADFAAWQRTRLDGDEIARQLADWKVRLAGPLPVLDLPTDRPRPAVQTFRGASETLVLPPDLAGALRGLGASHGATPFMVLLAGFALLLARWSGQRDLVVGTPIAGRDSEELEGLIGIFLNMLPLRIGLVDDPGFGALVDQVREVALAAYARQDVPVERLIEEVQPERDLSRSPLFQVLFNLQDFPRRAFDVPGLAIEALPLRETPSRFDLTLYGEETRDGGIGFELVYNADLFDAATQRQLLAQLRQLLEGAVANPDRPVSRLSLVTPEAAAVLPDPRAPLAAGGWAGAVHERFVRQARLTPERLAVTDSQGIWTYGELAARATRLARRLRGEGIGRGDLVAVYAARSASLVEALLGILIVGAAFLILDPGHPASRLRSVVSRGRPRAWMEIAAAGPPPPELRETLPAVRIALAASAPAAPEPDAELPLPARPDDLAYVAFTSGSTGEPKGILGTHGPLAHFCAWHAEQFGLGADDRFSLLSGLSHDPLLRDVFTPLSLGALLCIPGADDPGSPQRLAGWMARQWITVSHLTPALGQLLADGGAPLPALRRAFFGGDVLTERDVARLRAVAPGVASVNFYGTTETPQAMAWHDVSQAGAWPGRRVPVGRGIDGVQLLVLNDAGDLAAPGELGEICIRTPHLSRGYLEDERLTTERFAANPFTNDPADRIYRTGDLGRYRAGGSGEVDLAGRRDRQVQVRGFRVEPAEVEAALALHPAVGEAAVLLQGGVLAAFLVVEAGAARPRRGEMRDFLRGLLPDPMVPEAFVWLDRLPLTPNGKLDRAALEALEALEAKDGKDHQDGKDEKREAFEAPATPLEEAIAGIWRRLLGLERVGRHESFFELGGHSLLGARVIGAVREVFDVEVPLRSLFERPTVAELARVVSELRSEAADRIPRLSRVPGVPNRFPVAPAQLGGWTHNVPGGGKVIGALDLAVLERSVQEIVRRHEALRTTFHTYGRADREPVQVVAPELRVAMPLLDLTALPAAARQSEARRLSRGELTAPFDLERGPLLRLRMVRLSRCEHLLLATAHPAVADGGSMAIFLRELGALYAAFAAGGPSPLPELPVQYADFAAWQRGRLTGRNRERQLAYWSRQLAGAPPLELPTDRPRLAVRHTEEGRIPFVLPEDLAAGLRDLAGHHGASLFMGLLAAFSALLGQSGGQSDVTVGTLSGSRNRSELENLIGPFANRLALRLKLDGGPSFRQLLDRARQVTLQAFAHQDVPFEKVLEAMRIESGGSRAPLFQVLLVFQLPQDAVDLPGVRLEPAPPERGHDGLDLSLWLEERAGRLTGSFLYSRALFEEATVARLGEDLKAVIGAALAEPERPVYELLSMPPALPGGVGPDSAGTRL